MLDIMIDIYKNSGSENTLYNHLLQWTLLLYAVQTIQNLKYGV